MAIKAIIFDCFGVLVLSGKESVYHDFPQLSTQLRDLSLQSDYGYMSRTDFNKEFSSLTGIAFDGIEAHYWANNVRNEALFKWVKEIKAGGTYKLGLLTNIGKDWLDDFLPSVERQDLFDAEVLSGEVGITKPDVRIYEMLAQKLGVEPEECVMIDDLLPNIEGAKRAGMKAVIFGSNNQVKADLKKVLDENA